MSPALPGRLSIGPIYGIQADNPDVLRDYLSALLHSIEVEPLVQIHPVGGDEPFLQLHLPCCNTTKVYEQLEDVPRENVGPCKCGNWFIYYKESA